MSLIGTILVLLFFSVCTSYLSDNLKANAKLIAGDTSFTCIVEDNTDLNKITKLAYQWKINSNSDKKKKSTLGCSQSEQWESNATFYIFQQNSFTLAKSKNCQGKLFGKQQD